MMTKRDFIALAKVLHEEHANRYLVEKIADLLLTLNPRFNKERFILAVFGD